MQEQPGEIKGQEVELNKTMDQHLQSLPCWRREGVTGHPRPQPFSTSHRVAVVGERSHR